MIIIANWKMNLGLSQSKFLANDFANKFKNTDKEIVICPDFVSLDSVGEIIREEGKIKLGAQDVFWQSFGSYTGEVCYGSLEEAGCEYVILGHSERRQNLGETDEMVNKKVKAILALSKITPIICIGESLQDRQKNNYESFLTKQIELALKDIDLKNKKAIIAYEPIWAIGTGEPIQAQDAEAVHKMIYAQVETLFGAEVAQNNFKIIYGGSVKGQNVKNFINLERIDGFLIGGASLNADEFYNIAMRSM